MIQIVVTSAARGCTLPHKITLTTFLTMALDLEEQQYVYASDNPHSMGLIMSLGVTFNLRSHKLRQIRQASNWPTSRRRARRYATEFVSGAKYNLYIYQALRHLLLNLLLCPPALKLLLLPLMSTTSYPWSLLNLSLFIFPRRFRNIFDSFLNWLHC